MGRVIYSLLGINHSTESASTLSKMQDDGTLNSPKLSKPRSNSLIHKRAQSIDVGDASFINDALQKKERCDYFNQVIIIILQNQL
jgi:hypothetical protein